MDGSGASTMLNITSEFVFTIDYTQQILYWIVNNGNGCNNNNHIIGHSNVDGFERGQTVITSYCFLFGYNLQAIDFYKGTLYSYSGDYYFKIFKILQEEEIATIEFDGNYMSEYPSSYTGMKVISDQRQLQGCFDINKLLLVTLSYILYCICIR